MIAEILSNHIENASTQLISGTLETNSLKSSY